MCGKQRCGSAQCGTVCLNDGTRLYVSYTTVVGIEHEGEAIFTDAKYSVTTSKQRNTKLYPLAGYTRVKVVPHADFIAICKGHGLSIRQQYGPESVLSPTSF